MPFQNRSSMAGLTTNEATKTLPLVDLPGLLALAALIFSIPTLYSNTEQTSQRPFQLVAIIAIAANLHHFSIARLSLPMISLGVLWGLFSITAFSSQDADVWDSFTVWGKFTVLAILLSLMVCKRAQFLVVLGALAASAIVVAYSSHDALLRTQEAVGQARSGNGTTELARTAGAFANENTLGMYAIYSIMASVTLYFCTRRWFTLILCIASGASAAYLALFSGSRKAVLGMAVVIAFIIFVAVRNRKKMRLTTQLVVLAIGGALMAWLLTNPYLGRFDRGDDSYQDRNDLVQEALEYAQEYPLIGLGYQGFGNASKSGMYTHSTPLEILCNGGVLALAIYGLLWWGLARSLYKCLAMATDESETILLYGIACYCVIQIMSSLTSVVIEEPLYLVVTACICGYLRSKEIELRAATQPLRRAMMATKRAFGPP